MAFSQPASSQMQTRMKQSIEIYNKRIADLNARLPRLEAFIPKLQFYMPSAIATEAQAETYQQSPGLLLDTAAGSR